MLRLPSPFQSALYWAAFALPCLALAVLLQHYIEFTDQIYYLLHVSKPHEVQISANLYYLYLAPIFDWLNQNQYHYRLFGLAALIIGSLPLGFIAQKALFAQAKPAGFWPVFLLAVISFYKPFLVDPGYNWFNTIAIMLFAAGMAALIYPVISYRMQTAGILIGLGGWLSFAAKPTTGAILALLYVIMCIILLAQKKQTLRTLIPSALYAGGMVLLLAAFHFTVLDSIATFQLRLASALAFYSLIQGGYDFASQLVRIYFDLEGVLGVIFQPSIFFWPAFILSFTPPGKKLCQNHPFIAIALFALTLVTGLIIAQSTAGAVFTQGGMGVKIMFLGFYTMLIVGRLYLHRYIGLHDKAALLMLLCLFGITYAYRVGSNLHYVFLLNYQGAILLLAVLFMAKAALEEQYYFKLARRLILPMFCLLFISIWYQAYHKPQRSPVPVYKQTLETQITDDPANILYLEPLAHEYITKARAAFNEHGFKAGDFVIDMTGTTPLIHYISNATPPPFPWIAGGYSGSDAAALDNLRRVPEELLSTAWILTSGKGCATGNDIDLDVLEGLGLRFPDDYHPVTELTAPDPIGHCQTLWKPN